MAQVFVLVLVILLPTKEALNVNAQNMGFFKSNVDCFKARESLSVALFEFPSGYYPPNTQAVCIPLEFDPRTLK
jgi:hypothetical protein